MYQIVRKRVFSPTLKLMDVKAPDVARNVKAGQFVILRIDEKGERIPLTVADYDRQAGTITIIFQEVGYSTMALGKLEEGDYLLDFVGPLGEPTEVENYGKVICVGGGVGIAPIFPIARALKEAGNEVVSIIGARNKDLLFWEEEMRAVSDRLYVATDDGSYGRKGFVTDILKELLEQEKVDRVWGIGPLVMMRAVSEVTRPYGVKTIVSMNPIMVDGTGMCGACRLSVGNETKFACVDGPEFDGHLVDWELAIRRSQMYRDEEKRALAKAQCGGGCGCH
ncbi:MAG TPA: sulfide/dihydroorotate dehydrogenase-like FAD/NAD-binding protein [Clostridia bacterium]|nr:sulfide/dihydroorotate dehydrogenase-like FAD/NAD-binding protein [Clostridia bacterium]